MKYTTQKPSAFYDDTEAYEVADPVLVASTAIAEDAPASTWSGLYDADGNKLYRERESVGFAVTA